eukprot:364946-Chlamydomonas_euryale.AAC.2
MLKGAAECCLEEGAQVAIACGRLRTPAPKLLPAFAALHGQARCGQGCGRAWPGCGRAWPCRSVWSGSDIVWPKCGRMWPGCGWVNIRASHVQWLHESAAQMCCSDERRRLTKSGLQKVWRWNLSSKH